MSTNKGGFYYKVSPEKINWWRSIPAKQKLEWLEDANSFLKIALSAEKRRIMERFRKGEINVRPNVSD